MRLPIPVLLLSMLLSGCWWEGPAFYKGDPADAGPVKPGLYRADVLGDHKRAETVRLEWLPDGSINVVPIKPPKNEKAGDISRVVLHRFPVPGHELWVVQYEIANSPDGAIYGALEQRGDIITAMATFDCDATAGIVRSAGGIVSGGFATTNDVEVASVDARKPRPMKRTQQSDLRTNQTCTFKDRASFERALAAYMATNPDFPTRVRLKRIGD